MGVFLKIFVSNSATAEARRVKREDCREVVAAVAEADRRVRPLVPSQLEPVFGLGGGRRGGRDEGVEKEDKQKGKVCRRASFETGGGKLRRKEGEASPLIRRTAKGARAWTDDASPSTQSQSMHAGTIHK
jgi:hypothetical protein